MSDFIMIAPEGWLALDTSFYENNTELTKSWITNVNSTSLYEVATRTLIEHGDMREDQILQDIRIINDEFWAKIV